PGLVAHDLGTVRHVICGSPKYFRKHGKPRVPQDLREHNCLVDQYSGPKTWPFQNSRRPLLVEVKGTLSSNSNATLIPLDLDACWLIRVPFHSIKAELASKRLEAIFKNVSLSPERLTAYCARTRRLPAKTAEFISFLTAAVRRREPD